MHIYIKIILFGEMPSHICERGEILVISMTVVVGWVVVESEKQWVNIEIKIARNGDDKAVNIHEGKSMAIKMCTCNKRESAAAQTQRIARFYGFSCYYCHQLISNYRI